MAVYDVLTFPHPFLKTVAKPVVEFTDELAQEAQDMIETMYDAPGVGLAAIQVGIDKRMFVMDVYYNPDDPDSTPTPTVVINPEIVDGAEEQMANEGCLSVPEFRAEVKRFAQLTLRFQNLQGEPQEMAAEGFLAVCIQHETDHLNGKLFIDRLPPLQRKMIKTKLKKRAEINA